MQSVTRRVFLSQAAGFAIAASRPTDVRIEDLRFDYEDYTYRTPIKFAGVVVDKVTLLNVHAVVRNSSGKTSKGFGSMPLGNIWAYPSKMPYERTLEAMKVLAGRIAKLTAAYQDYGHPIDLNWALEAEYRKAAAEVSRQLKLEQAIPDLATLVVASPFDAAVHDAYGKLHGRNCFLTYGPDFMKYDLAQYLGKDFKGEYLSQYVLEKAKPRMPLYHLVGAVDPIFPSDVAKPVGDGLPETLPEWILRDGLTHLKIKLNGEDLKWDVERVLRVDQAARETQARRGVTRWVYSLDFNEKCPNVGYLLEFLRRIKAASPSGFEKIQYVEQPTGRDLKANRHNVMHEASKLRPVVIDESLTSLENLLLAREMGYTGTALKACKGQGQALLMAAAAQKYRMFLCVQDLTCPGASLIHSASIAAHVPGVAAIEANSRQYVPVANRLWDNRFPGVFTVRNGEMNTALLDGPGLGAVHN